MRMKQAAVIVFLLVFTIGFLPQLRAGDGGGGKGKKKTARTTRVRNNNFQVFNEQYYEDRSQESDPEIDRLRAIAKVSVNEVDEQNRYVEYLSPADLNRLPIGLKKRVGNSTIKIAVSSAIFTPQYAELTVYAKVDIPQNNSSNVGTGNAKKTIFFGVKGLRLSKDGGLIGNAKLVLLGDYAIPINGNKSALVLKGGFDIRTGQSQDKTYITIDCNGFKELGLNADIEFPRSLLVPTDADGNQIAGLVKGNFSTVVSNWNDILASITLPAFEIKGIDGVGYKIDNAVIDLSDYRNSNDFSFPQGYQQKYIGSDPEVVKLWRGVYAREIRVILPKSFVNRDSTNKRVAFGANNLIVDNNGLTGILFAENVIPLDKGTAAGWQFSVDSFRVALEANRLLRAGFGGRVGIPVNRTDSMMQLPDSVRRDMIKRKFLAYSAVMSSSGDYLCRVVTKDSLSFDVWKANVLLLPNSYIQLEGNKTAFRPSAMLHGRMDIVSNTGTNGALRATNIIDFKGVVFQGLNIKTTAPYLTAQYFGYNGAIKIGKFPVSIDSIALKTFSPTEVGIGFNLKVTMQDSAFSGKTRLYVVGKYVEEASLVKWKYDRLKIEDITINAQIGKVSLNGTVIFLDNDPKYGDGFKGNINLGVKFRATDSLAVSVTAVFGHTSYRYWFVDGTVAFPGSGIPLGALNINGFGGGAFYRMKKGDYVPGITPSGFDYVPDSTAGLGLRASVIFNVGSEKIDNGQASLEVAFNRGGGMRYIGFYGFMKLMAPLNLNQLPGGNAISFMQSQFQNIETKIKGMSPDSLQWLMNTKVLNPTTAAKSLYGSSNIPPPYDLDMRAVLGISYDFNNNIFHANFDFYVTTPGNFISGTGADGRAGWAVLHIDPSIWYLHIGTPTDPIGLKIGIGPLSVQTSAYFMLGHNLPAFPPLPGPLLALMAQNNIQYQSNIGIGEVNDIKAGKGIAFGGGVNMNTGDVRFLILYASFQAGMGFDVMIKDYSNYVCTQTGQSPGINGWYAQGRVYAYLQGECGVRIKLGPIVKKIPIIKGAAVALLEARLPKPSWFGGLFHISVHLLGGKIRINLNLKFSFGDECTLSQASNGSIDFDEFRVVTSVTPANNATNVSLFSRPVINCLTAPEGVFELPVDEQSNVMEKYRPHISSIFFTKGAQQFGCTYKISTDSTKITVYPDSAFKAQTNYGLTIKIQYQKMVSGTWVNMTNPDGTSVIETTTANFITGDNPPNIPDENIGFMYPFKNQRFFYKNEMPQGKVFTTTNRADLFSSFTQWKARFYKATGRVLIASTAVSYNGTSKLVTYNIPTELQTNTSYIMEVYGEGYVPGGIVNDTTRPILEIPFKTSNYTTLSAKLTALQQMNPTPVVGRVESDVIDLQANVSGTYEGFDLAELASTPLTGTKPLVDAFALLDNENYYNTKIKNLLKYPTFFPSDSIIVIRDTSITDIGLIPTRAIGVSGYYLNALTGGSYNTILYDRLPYIYDLNKIFNQDFIELRTKIINKKLSNMTGAPLNVPMYEWYRPCFLCAKRQRLTAPWVAYFASAAYQNSLGSGNINNIPVDMRDIVTKPFPFMSQGNYPVDFALNIPTGWASASQFTYARNTSGQFVFTNPIGTSTYFNVLQTGTFTKNNCPSGETGTSVTFSIPAGQFTSGTSQAAADQLAINALNAQGQAYANQVGQCCVSGNCYTPGVATINLSSYLSGCQGYSFSITLSGNAGTFTYQFPMRWYGDYSSVTVPSGTYSITLNSNGYTSRGLFSMDNPWSSYNQTVTIPGVSIAPNASYGFTVSSTCGGISVE